MLKLCILKGTRNLPVKNERKILISSYNNTFLLRSVLQQHIKLTLLFIFFGYESCDSLAGDRLFCCVVQKYIQKAGR
jgi:hypothetical protein